MRYPIKDAYFSKSYQYLRKTEKYLMKEPHTFAP